MGVPTTHSRRPPGRPAQQRRRPEGHATVPRNSTRAHAIEALPDAREAVTYLKAQGEDERAAAVAAVVDYAQEAIDASIRKARRDTELDPNYSLYVEDTFRTWVRTAADKAGKELAAVVTAGMNDFLNGRWTPPAPVRAPKGQTPTKVSLNVRISEDLFDQVDALAKDPDATAERGYALNARQVAIAALARAFPKPKKSAAK